MKLLISPINVREAVAAIKGGADIIDVKNPREGSLGANFPWVIREIKGLLPPGVELSATLGDLDFKPGTASLAAHGLSELGVDYVKAGFYGIEGGAQALELARGISTALGDGSSRLVVAGYAEHRKLGCVSPFLLPEIAHKVGAYGVMIDTAKKDGRSLLHHLGLEELRGFVEGARDLGLKAALAGALQREDIAKLKEIGPDIIGVRGLVCSDGDRMKGRISVERVRELREFIL